MVNFGIVRGGKYLRGDLGAAHYIGARCMVFRTLGG